MKVLTLTQPWAQLVAEGHKTIETRSWPVAFRGELAIHAAKGWTKADREFALECGYKPEEMARGVILCLVALIDVQPVTRLGPAYLTANERRYGNYSAGRYAWIFDPARTRRLLPPVEAKGAQGVWLIPDERLAVSA